MNAIAVGNNSPVADPADTSGERDRLGSIALDQWRGLRRLYPAMIAYTITMLGGTLLLQNRPDLPPFSDAVSYLKSMPLAFGYVINYFTGTSPMSLRHLWSIACEMQFYLLAPLIF